MDHRLESVFDPCFINGELDFGLRISNFAVFDLALGDLPIYN